MTRALLLIALGAVIALSATLAAPTTPLPVWGVHQVSAQGVPPDPGGPGPYPVGVTQRTFTRASSTTGEPRVLDTVIWYPATPAAAALPADESLAAPIEAVPERAGAPYPVLVWSHGSGVAPWCCTYLTTHLASHGFVIIAPAHSGNTATPECPAPCQPSAPAEREAVLDAIANRPDDLLAALDQTATLSRGADALLAGLVDADRVGVTGWSLGGSTALRLAGTTSRFRAVLAAAPGTRDPAVVEAARGVTVPTLIMAGLLDDLAPLPDNQQPLFAALPAAGSNHWLTVFRRGGHTAFSNLCPPVRAGCGPDDLPQEQAHGLINRWAGAFLLRYVAGDTRYGSLLDSILSAGDPETQVTVISGS